MTRKAASLEDQLDRLAELRGQPPSPEGRAQVVKFLNSKINLLAAKAARIAGEWKATELEPELVAACERFLLNGGTTDKHCEAKIAILKALCALEYASPAIFLRGLHYVQMEGTWGGTEDTAADVRALSAIGLAQTRYPDALEEIVPLLLDRERATRIGAVRAIAAAGLPGGTLLLRLKALTADEAEVRGECFAALLGVAPARSIEFVAQFLEHEDEAVAEAATLALGDSRLESAYAVLRDSLQRLHRRPLRRTLLLALALLRREPAIDFLLELVEQGDTQASSDAVAALAMYSQDPKIQGRLGRALAGRGQKAPSEKPSASQPKA